jgi:aminoglycoside 6'-N-acetyltransferase
VIRLRPATLADAPVMQAWNHDPGVIAATTDDPDETEAFGGVDWKDELQGQSDVQRYYIAEIAGRPIGAMQIMDPHLEPSHYWGDVAPNQRAVDIWIGSAGDRGKGYGEEMMRQAMALCFADPKVTTIIIDPLASNTRAHKFYRRLGFTVVGRRLFGEEDECLVHELTRETWLRQYA